MIVYLDSSCILRALLKDGPLLDGWGAWERAYTSDLTRVEVRRALYRAREERRLGETALGTAISTVDALGLRWGWIPIAPLVLDRAAQRRVGLLGALDAIHLVSAELVKVRGEPGLVFATHDRQLATAATALGFEVAGV